MAKSKKWIQAKKAEAFRAKNLGIKSKLFFISAARKTFAKLRQTFVKTPILNHLDLNHHIQIEINASGYVIGKILNQLISNDLG